MMTMEPTPGSNAELERRLSATLIRLRARSPFFAALALFARMERRDSIPTAATDGRDIFWNPDFLRSLTLAEVGGVLLHEVLHAALLHVVRRGKREPRLWNIAADIVVNGMIAAEAERIRGSEQAGSMWHAGPAATAVIALPEGALRSVELEKFSVEEVYELIRGGTWTLPEAWRDLLEGDGFAGTEGGRQAQRAQLEAHWRAAHAQAATLQHGSGRGSLPAELTREISALEPSLLDWRSRLWRFLVRTPTDFTGFDRRFIGRGLYLEALEGESLRIHVGIDTSGSIGDRQLAQFLGEVRDILRAYPHVTCSLYYVDASAHGPYPLSADTDVSAFPRPIGGGGTDFRPFFDAVNKDQTDGIGGNTYSLLGGMETLCVYLTDGYGSFPDPTPDCETLWVVLPGGLELNAFPFGETVRLV